MRQEKLNSNLSSIWTRLVEKLIRANCTMLGIVGKKGGKGGHSRCRWVDGVGWLSIEIERR